MAYEYLHELERVTFHAVNPRPVAELVTLFRLDGFTLHDDVFSLDRQGQIPPWQHSSIIEVHMNLGDKELFAHEDGTWDTLVLDFLFASLPFENVECFIQVVQATSDYLGIVPEFLGSPTDTLKLRTAFQNMREELFRETGSDPGSEALAILIDSTYPRKFKG